MGWRKRPAQPARQYLVTLRVADQPHLHPHTEPSECFRCGEPVAIYPSGHTLLRRYPDLMIICGVCRSC